MSRARLFALGLALSSLHGGAHAAETSLAPFAQVDVAPVATWAYLANITLVVDRFQRAEETYSAPYTAKILPYFLLNEKGTLRIKISDADLIQLSRGQPIEFKGSAIRDRDGKERAVEGRATPVDSAGGLLKVKLFYTQRIVLTFSTTYRLPGLAPASVPVK